MLKEVQASDCEIPRKGSEWSHVSLYLSQPWPRHADSDHVDQHVKALPVIKPLINRFVYACQNIVDAEKSSVSQWVILLAGFFMSSTLHVRIAWKSLTCFFERVCEVRYEHWGNFIFPLRLNLVRVPNASVDQYETSIKRFISEPSTLCHGTGIMIIALIVFCGCFDGVS